MQYLQGGYAKISGRRAGGLGEKRFAFRASLCERSLPLKVFVSYKHISITHSKTCEPRQAASPLFAPSLCPSVLVSESFPRGPRRILISEQGDSYKTPIFY